MNDWKTWLYSLVAAFIQAAATSITVVVVDPIAFNFGEQWQKTAAVALVSGLMGAALYLKDSPLPGYKRILPFLLTFALLFPLTACNEDERTKLMAVSADFFDGLETVSSLTESYNKSMQRITNAQGKTEYRQQLSDGDAKQIYDSLDRVGRGVSSFKKVLKDTPVITPNNKEKFLPVLDNIFGELDKLNEQAVFFQSDGAKTKFSNGVKIATGSITVLRTRLARIRSPVATADLPLGKFVTN